MEQCLNKVGTALRTFRLTSLAHLPDPEFPKSCPKAAKECQNKATKKPFAHIIGPQVETEVSAHIGTKQIHC